MSRLAVLAVLAAAVFALTVTGTAAAKTPCWQRVIDDWTANDQLDRTYSVTCYRQALKHIPEDLRDYTPIVDDISTAMHAVLRNNTGGGSKTGGGGTSTANAAQPSKHATKAASARLSGSETNQLPMPLILLGSLALALLGAAGGVRLYRLVKDRHDGPRAIAARGR
ncbi:MAG: hypothetical protein M3R26_00690 [Actinomycetota bacterium]|nr:hypothetical protein [Actinomycetota bacterium]MDQ2982543.1 hypothetical protein [Actinomycetota bacterium]